MSTARLYHAFGIRGQYVRTGRIRTCKVIRDRMKSCYFISVVGNPALAVPCALTSQGLPVGLQIAGRHQDDWGVLELGYAFEQATGLWKRKPAIAT